MATKMATGHKTHWVDNHPMIILQNMVYITSLIMEKMQFNHFPIVSL